MQSLVLTRDGLQVADTPIPPLLPGNVRIEVRSVGICSDDLAIWKGHIEANLPLILGHEISGVVHESSVPEIQPGTLVTTEAEIFCGQCWYCRRNQTNLCSTKQSLGYTVDGGLAEFLSVPADIVHALPEGIDSRSGTFVEPLAAAIHTAEVTTAESDEVVAVLGSGKLGLIISQVYDAMGAEVFLIGRNRRQLGLAKQLGLSNIVNMQETDWKKALRDATSGVGPRVVIEATGSPDGVTMALEVVRSRGVIAIKSTHGKLIAFDTTDIVTREITIQGTSGGSFDRAIDFLDKGRIEVKRLISKEFTLEKGAEAFAFADEPSTTKVLVNI